MTTKELPQDTRNVIAYVAWHLAKQRKRSFVMKGTLAYCSYRNDQGCMCSVGALIPDHLYYPELEGRNVVALFGANGSHLKARPKLLAHLAALFSLDYVRAQQTLDAIQQFHDYQDHYADHLSRADGLSDYDLARILEKDMRQSIANAFARLEAENGMG